MRDVRRLFARVDHAVVKERPDGIVIATLDPFVLAVAKLRMLRSWATYNVLGVFHELLAALERKPGSSHWWSLRAALALPHPRRLKYMVLASSILAYLHQRRPGLAKHTFAVDHPSLLGDLGAAAGREDARNSVSFGFVGGGRGRKGFREFLELAHRVLERSPDADFEIVGSAPLKLAAIAPPQLRWSSEKLPLDEFVRRIRRLSYVIWLGRPEHYHLVASGSFVDALAVGTPIICLRGSFVDHFFDRFGAIGIRCGEVGDVADALHRLLNDSGEPPQDGYASGLARAKALLSPEESLTPDFRAALQGSEGSAKRRSTE
jgi:glycosyltransferase involved in cell wall biosynthesis